MKKKNYSHLRYRKAAFYQLSTRLLLGDALSKRAMYFDLSALLSECEAAGVEVLFLVCSMSVLTREWFFSVPPVSYNHEYRSGSYEVNGKTFHVKHAGAWFDLQPETTAADCYAAWGKLSHWIRKATNNQIPLMSAPSQVGLRMLETMLPGGQEFVRPPAQIEEYILNNTPQARKEIYKPRLSDLQGCQWFYYDMRWAYAAAVQAELPGEFLGESEYDTPISFAECDMYGQGWVWVRFQVPENYGGVGQIPVRGMAGFSAYQWPVTGKGNVLCTKREARAAVQAGWEVMVKAELNFSTVRPLRVWATKLIQLREKESCLLYRSAIRNILLHSVGAMYAHKYTRETGVSRETFAESAETLSRAERLSAVRVGEEVRMRSVQEKQGRELDYFMPHWTSQIWAECRVRLAGAMGEYLPAELIACNLDGFYATRESQSIAGADNGAVGKFREKGRLSVEGLRAEVEVLGIEKGFGWNQIEQIRRASERGV